MRMKIGSQTGLHDDAGNEILVGMNICCDFGYYYVNTYLQAVPYGDGKAFPVADIAKKFYHTEIVDKLPVEYKQIGEVCPCRGMGTAKKKDVECAAKVEPSPEPEKKAETKGHRDIEKEILEGEQAIEQVNHPAHYNNYGIEVIDMMVSLWGKDKVADWCEITAFKYRMRMGTKSGNPIQQDIDKEAWYLNKAKELRG